MLHQIGSYLHFLFHATNQHGVHSPFVYDLVTQCFYDTQKHPEYDLLKRHRKQLLEDKRTIEVTDFGAGSRVFKTNQRRISAIAKHVGIPSKEQKLLFRLVRYFKPENMLELGTSLGMGTLAMGLGHPEGTLTSLEGCPQTVQTAGEYLKKFNIQANLLTTEFHAFLEKDTQKYDLVYVDGHHEKKATLSYFNLILNKIHNDSLLIFDDIHWSSGMTEAWEEIIQHPTVTVSIDCFDWGLVFFRKEQRKQHFRIRV